MEPEKGLIIVYEEMMRIVEKKSRCPSSKLVTSYNVTLCPCLRKIYSNQAVRIITSKQLFNRDVMDEIWQVHNAVVQEDHFKCHMLINTGEALFHRGKCPSQLISCMSDELLKVIGHSQMNSMSH